MSADRDQGVVHFNDNPSTTQSEVLSRLDQAIAKEKK